MRPSTDAVGDPDSLGALVQDYLGAQCRAILASRAPLRDLDEAAVHPARVAIRRIRATLHTFAGVYRRVDREAFAAELTWFGGLLGGIRDLQVLEVRFADDHRVPEAVAEMIRDEAARRRASAWNAVVAAAASARGVALFAVIDRWIQEPPFRAAAARPAQAARRRVDAAEDDLKRLLQRARETRDDSHIHAARKAVKRHRYALELARPVLAAQATPAIAQRETLQDALGAHQDAVVAVAFLCSVPVTEGDPTLAEGLRTAIDRARRSAQDLDEVWALID